MQTPRLGQIARRIHRPRYDSPRNRRPSPRGIWTLSSLHARPAHRPKPSGI